MRRLLGFAALAGMLSLSAHAQDYPTKAVTIIVPSSPGGISDTGARIVAEGLSKIWSQPVVVENRPGGGGSIGTGLARRAQPDGYTLLATTNGEFALNPVIYPNLPYDPNKDFAPLALMTYNPIVIAVNTSAPFQTYPELIAAAKKEPGSISWSSAGTGTWNHLAGEWWQMETGTKMVHVPYKGGGPAATAVAGGDVPVGLVSVSSIMPHVKSGKVKIVAVTSKEKSAYDTSWPTTVELGAPNLDAVNWVGLFAPTGIDPKVAKKIEEDVIKVLQQPETRQRFLGMGTEPVGMPGEGLAQKIKQDRAVAERVAKAANIRVN